MPCLVVEIKINLLQFMKLQAVLFRPLWFLVLVPSRLTLCNLRRPSLINWNTANLVSSLRISQYPINLPRSESPSILHLPSLLSNQIGCKLQYISSQSLLIILNRPP